MEVKKYNHKLLIIRDTLEEILNNISISNNKMNMKTTITMRNRTKMSMV